MAGPRPSGGGIPSGIGIDDLADARRIGEGGNAVVYRAHQVSLDRTVAVKVLRGVDDDTRRRFDRERRAMGRLSEHDGIVTVYASGFTDRGEPYLVMPLLERSLDEVLEQRGPLPWREAAELMATVCETVADAHDQGIVHRDLKPGNIMLTASGRPLVADFGIARLVDRATSLQSTALTLTPAYSPPEALESTLATARADIYSLGATLFALVCGHPPFMEPNGETSLLVLVRRIVEQPVPDCRPRVPDGLQRLLEWSMAKEPEHRPATARELAVALRDVAASDSITAGATGTTVVDDDGQSPATVLTHDPTPGRPSPPADTPSPGGFRPALIALLAGIPLAAAVLWFALGSGGGSLSEAPTAAATTPTSAPGDPDDAGAVTSPPTGGDDEPTDDRDPVGVGEIAGGSNGTDDTGSDEPDDGATSADPPGAQDETAGEPDDAAPATVAAATDTPLVGPIEIEPYATTIVASGDLVWTSAPRAGANLIGLDPETGAEVRAIEPEFFAVFVAAGEGWVAAAGIEGQLAVFDLDTDDVATTQLEGRPVGLAASGDRLWSVSVVEGEAPVLHLIDPAEPAIRRSVPVEDIVLRMDAAADRVWLVEGSRVVSYDTRLERVVDIAVEVSPIDDLDATADTVWVSGSVFSSDLAGQDLALAAVVPVDASTGAVLPTIVVDDGLSIFETASVAAVGDGAWVAVETTERGVFVDRAGPTGLVVELPPRTTHATTTSSGLWVLSGGSTNGSIWLQASDASPGP